MGGPAPPCRLPAPASPPAVPLKRPARSPPPHCWDGQLVLEPSGKWWFLLGW